MGVFLPLKQWPQTDRRTLSGQMTLQYTLISDPHPVLTTRHRNKPSWPKASVQAAFDQRPSWFVLNGNAANFPAPVAIHQKKKLQV